MHTHTKSEDALDLWESEDLTLRMLFTRLQQSQGESVEQRAAYGDAAKEIVRHMALREAAIAEVARALESEPELESTSATLEGRTTARRSKLHEVEKKSRGVQGINLNTGQDFHGPLIELVQQVGPEIEWDLDDAVPAIRGTLGEETPLHSADHLSKHAPSSLKGPRARWIERAPVLSRLKTLYDRLRDFPMASQRQ